MQVTLSPRAEELVQRLARSSKQSPEELIEYALQSLAGSAPPTEEEKERWSKAVDAMLAFQEEHHLTLGPGVRIKDLIEEGRKY